MVAVSNFVHEQRAPRFPYCSAGTSGHSHGTNSLFQSIRRDHADRESLRFSLYPQTATSKDWLVAGINFRRGYGHYFPPVVKFGANPKIQRRRLHLPVLVRPQLRTVFHPFAFLAKPKEVLAQMDWVLVKHHLAIVVVIITVLILMASGVSLN